MHKLPETFSLRSASITAGGTTTLGGWNPVSEGSYIISGGTYFNTNNNFAVGRGGDGTLDMYGGTLQLQENVGVVWNPLRTGTGEGSGTVNLYGGEIISGGLLMEQASADAGTGTFLSLQQL